MITHTGKIARLPSHIRHELNHRLGDGETEAIILPWLNAQPAVQAILAAQFHGRPISQQNLTNWRQGGYQHWLKLREHSNLVREVAHDAQKLGADPKAPDFARNVSTVLMAELAVSARNEQEQLTTATERLNRLQELIRTVTQVRREDQRVEWLNLERERYEFEQQEKQYIARCRPPGPANFHARRPVMEEIPASLVNFLQK